MADRCNFKFEEDASINNVPQEKLEERVVDFLPSDVNLQDCYHENPADNDTRPYVILNIIDNRELDDYVEGFNELRDDLIDLLEDVFDEGVVEFQVAGW